MAGMVRFGMAASHRRRSSRPALAGAICIVALCAAFGPARGVEAQIPEADVPAFETGAEALLRLGNLYRNGEAIGRDLGKAFAYFGKAAEAGSVAGKLSYGEMLARGEGVAQDLDAGLAIIGEVAANGDPDAFLLIGDLFSEGKAAPVDAELAIASYDRAASLGSTDALVELGDLHTEGEIVPVDLQAASDYYRRAAEAGSRTGRVRYGETLVLGRGVAADPEEGLALIGKAADAGDARALVALGDLLLRGEPGAIDVDGAVDTFGKAAALGDREALMRLGYLYRNGVLVKADWKKAIAYFRKAADGGNVYADYAIGRMLLDSRARRIGKVEDGLALLEAAGRSGYEEAAAAIGEAYLDGGLVRRDLKRGLALLEAEREKGNLAAARRLVGLYRDGYRERRSLLVRQDKRKAEAYLREIEPRLGIADREYERILFDASYRRGRDYGALYRALEKVSPQDRGRLVREMRMLNPNAYVYFIQARFEELGIFRGRRTGQLDKPTVRAMNDYCAKKGVSRVCRFGPMSGEAGEILTLAF